MNIVGHQKIQKILLRSIERGAVSHAYIFAGPQHLGKFGVALGFAERLAGNSREVNPDIIVIGPDTDESKGIIRKKEIKIEKIRELQHQLRMTSHFGKYKIAIVDDADRMNKSAQNAMLKILEEPAEKVAIILIAANLNKILPTIISRCVLKKFSPVSEREIRKILPANLENGEEIIFWSLGRPGLAKALLENPKELESRREAEKELAGLPASNISERFSLAEKMSKDSSALMEKLGWWVVLLRENLIGRKKMFSCPLEKIFKFLEQTQKSVEIMRETNSNPRLVLENLFMDF